MKRPILETETVNMLPWQQTAMNLKVVAVAATKRGDLNPAVIAERKGKIVAIVIAPKLDKHDGLKACEMARVGMAADTITAIFDAHTTLAPIQSVDEFRQKYPNGMQQACDDQGACETGEISDCLICHRIDRQGQITMSVMPYNYHGEGTTFKWNHLHFYTMTSKEDGTRLEGLIPETLRQVMALESMMHNPMLKGLAPDFGLDDYKRWYHTSRAAMRFLREQGFIVMDNLSTDEDRKRDEREGAAPLPKGLIVSS